MIVCHPFMLMITRSPLNVASSSGIPPIKIGHHEPSLHDSSKVKSPCHIPTVATKLPDEKSLTTRRTIHQLPPSTGPNSHDHGLQVYLQTPSSTVSKFVPSWPPNDYLQTRSITDSKLAQSWPACASTYSLDPGLQVHLHTSWITALQCISEFTRA
jgi:hypothetical protein